MTEHTDLPDVEDEVSHRTARLEKLAQHYGNPFHLTQFAKTATDDMRFAGVAMQLSVALIC
jgi:hypothetical protein